MKPRRSFFERLTGAVRVDDDFEHDNFEYEEEHQQMMSDPIANRHNPHLVQHHIPEHKASQSQTPKMSSWMEEEVITEGELTVYVYQDAEEIVIKTMVAGVRPEDIDISATRDTVTIRGKREVEKDIRDEDYFHRELYWGSFSRTIALPAEVEPEEAEVTERHGLLVVRLPKINKGKQTKLKVKSY